MAVAIPPSPDHAPMARLRSLVAKLDFDQGQAARYQQRAADALQRPGRDQHAQVDREAGQQRCHAEPDDPDDVHPPATEQVAQRATQQDQSRQGDEVTGDDPLQPGHAGAEIPADGRERDVDHGGVEHGDARTDDGGEQHPPAGRGAIADRAGHRHPQPRQYHRVLRSWAGFVIRRSRPTPKSSGSWCPRTPAPPVPVRADGSCRPSPPTRRCPG